MQIHKRKTAWMKKKTNSFHFLKFPVKLNQSRRNTVESIEHEKKRLKRLIKPTGIEWFSMKPSETAHCAVHSKFYFHPRICAFTRHSLSFDLRRSLSFPRPFFVVVFRPLALLSPFSLSSSSSVPSGFRETWPNRPTTGRTLSAEPVMYGRGCRRCHPSWHGCG